MLITSSIPNMINGVSQQPATLRLASQAEEQVNWMSSVTDGLRKRPATRHLAKIASVAWDDAFLHTINRDAAEKYLVCIRAGVLTVFDARTGAQKTVTAPSGFGYLTGGVKSSFRAVTVADYTFIVNRSMTTAMNTAVSAATPNRGLITIKAGNYGKRYLVYVDGLLRGGYDTPDGSVSSHINNVRTGAIAYALYQSLLAGTYAGATKLSASYGVSMVSGDVILITSSLGGTMSLRIDDDTGGNASSAVVRSTQKFSNLPTVAPDGFTVEIIGDSAAKADNYHVKFVSEGSTGVWKETLKGSEQYKFSASTMPHILVREANGTFTFKPATWEDRLVGDAERIPNPSFIGRKINDVFFYRNRLGFLSDENVIMSKLAGFFDFWRDTAVSLLDTDPLDIAVSNSKVSILNHALPFNQTLLLFSDGAQFTLRSGDILSAETAYISQATEFESNTDVRPVGVGQYVYFPVPRGNYTGIREYFVDTSNDQNDALDTTSHCPHYIPKGISKMVASSSEDILVMLSETSPYSLWVYKFYFGDGGKLQSSWSEWRMSVTDRILSIEFLDSKLYLVIARDDGTYIESMEIESGALDTAATFYYHCDRMVSLTSGVYSSAEDTTTFTLPYSTISTSWVFMGGGDETYGEGYVPAYTRPTSSTVKVVGNWVGKNLKFGVRYTSKYRFSTFFVRQAEQGGGMSALDDGRLQVRRLFLSYADTAYFKTEVTPSQRQSSIREFTGRRIAAASATLGGVELSYGRFSIPIMARNKEVTVDITTDHFLPAAFSSAEWEATYHTRAKRL